MQYFSRANWLPSLILALGLVFSGQAAAEDFNPRVEHWQPWPEDYPQFNYSREELTERWERLHLRDQAPFPDAGYVRNFSVTPPEDPDAVALQLLDGWRDFHAGDFEAAFRAGYTAGTPGDFLAGRAWLAYVVHRVDDEDKRREMLQALIDFIEDNMDDRDPPPAYWEVAGLALVYGEYARTLSTNRARSEGIPGTVRDLVIEALETEPRQPAALGVLAGWHAEIIGRVGRVLARTIYGASRDEIPKYFDRALAIDPDLVQLHREYGEALLRVYGSSREDEALQHLRNAQEITPINAEDYLEQRRAERLHDAWRSEGKLP